MFGFLLGVIALCVLLVLPFLLLACLVRVALALVALPIRLAGGILKLALAAAGLVIKVAFGVLALVLAFVLIPLLPFIILGLGVWVVIRLLAPTPVLVR